MKNKRKVVSIFLVLIMVLTLIPPVKVEAATKVKINTTKTTIYIGSTQTLKIIGTSKKVTWSSSNKKVATVSSKGKVTPKKPGTTTITAKVSKKKYTCKVTVKKPFLKFKEKTLEVGQTYSLILFGTYIKSAKSSNSKVAAISYKKGRISVTVKAKKAGTATVTLTGKDGKNYACKFIVKQPALNATKKTLKAGKTYTLKLTGATAKSFKSNKTSVASVNRKGKIIAKKAGTATITVTDTNGKKYKCTVTVKAHKITEKDYIRMFYEEYGGSWDCEGTDVGAGMCTGRSLYTNDVYQTRFKISTETRVCKDRFILDMNDATPDDGVITGCIDDGYIWLAGTVDFDLYLYTQKNTKWSVKSEKSFINSYAKKYRENHANSYDEITFGEIYTMDIGGNTYYCVDHLDMNVRDIGNIYYYETLLVRKCDDKMLVYYMNDPNKQVGVDGGGVTESYIRERILY